MCIFLCYQKQWQDKTNKCLLIILGRNWVEGQEGKVKTCLSVPCL